jgi:Tol biopolymer transport system component/DNA-binding CsgD family transcriptional regulator
MSVEREQAGAPRKPEWTPRQREVLDLLARGYTNPQIAEALGITLDGAKWHVREVLTKLGVANREAAAEWWRRERSPLARLTGLLAAFASRAALAAAGALVVGVAAIAVIAALRDDGDELLGASTVVPQTPAATVGGQASPTPTPDGSIARLPGGDGPKVAWVSHGDIWVKAMSGADVQVTFDESSSAPQWSSSGKWLAFQRGNGVWVAGESSASVEVADVGRAGFEWSPVGDQLALDTADGRLLVWDPASGATRELARKGVFGSFAWSPDGRRIAFANLPVPGPTEGGRPSPGTLAMVDVASLAQTELAAKEPGAGWFVTVDWSGDGRSVLFWDNAAASASIAAGGLPLKSIDIAFGRVTLLADMHVYDDFVAVSGAEVAVIAGNGAASFRETWAGQGLLLGGATALSSVTPRDESVSSVAWSPDGTKLAYDSMPALLGVTGSEPARVGMMGRRIWVMDPVTGEVRQITGDPTYRDEYPQWSDDGKTIVFLRIENESEASIWMVSANGGTPVIVASGVTLADGWFGYYGHIDWPAVFDYWPD